MSGAGKMMPAGATAGRRTAFLGWQLLLSKLLLIAVLLFPKGVVAQTSVSGAISADAHWTLSGSPYVLSNEVVVGNGAKLVIDAGVQIYMGPGSRFTVQAGGVQVRGTATNPVRVLSDKARIGQIAAPGDWNQWVFSSGTVDTQLDYVVFQHGRGLTVQGCAPAFNYLDIRDQQGPAITLDLAASPAGIGNQASGNALNGVLVPSGDITGAVTWGLRGIPYVVTQGAVSVGSSPTITTINPSIIQAGETLTVNLTGTRLSGLASAEFSSPGLSAQILSGNTGTQAAISVTAATEIALGDADLRLLVDAGQVQKPAALTVVRQQPKLTSVAPATVLTGRSGYVLTVQGSNFITDSVVEMDGAALATTFVSQTQLQAALPTQTIVGSRSIRVHTPDVSFPGGSSLTDPLPLAVVQPQAAVDPAPISMVDGTSKNAALTLPYPAPAGDFQFTLTSSAPLIAEVPPTLIVPAGASTADFTVQGRSVGSAVITISRSGWNDTQVSVSVIEPPQTLALTPLVSALVGVTVGSESPVPRSLTPITAPIVGVAVGPAATGISPRAGVIGTQLSLAVQGAGLDTVTQVTLQPATGVSVGQLSVAADGRELSVPLTLSSDASLGTRRVVLTGASGEVRFARAENALFLVASPAPELYSLTPQVIEAGMSPVLLTARGINLRDVTGLRFEPADGISIVGSVTESSDATSLQFNVQAAADAVSGPRTLVVSTAGGESDATSVAANTVYVAHQVSRFESLISPLVGVQIGPVTPPAGALEFGPLLSAAVGVMVGDPLPPDNTRAMDPVVAPPVGIVLGSAVTQVTPHAGTVGSQVNLDIRGSGLDTISSVTFDSPEGIQVGTLAPTADGKQLMVPLTVAAEAAQTVRRLRLTMANGTAIPFANVADSQFLVAAPRPELYSIAPQVVLAGGSVTQLTVRGINLRDVTGVRISPAQGVAVVGTVTTNGDGTVLQVNVQADASASPGLRTLIVTTAGGESDVTQSANNSFQIASQTGGTLDSIVSPVVGVMVGSGSGPVSTDRDAYAAPVGVVVGSAISTFSPAGAMKGSVGEWVFTGVGLAAIGAVNLTASDGGQAAGITMGAPVSSVDGTEVRVSYTVSQDAEAKFYRVDLLSGTAAIPVMKPGINLWQVLEPPAISSVSPTVLQQGKSYSFTVRGQNLRYVQELVFDPSAGITVDSGAPAYTTDGLGDLLTVRLIVDGTASTGTRVVRLLFPGGVTDPQATTANTVNVVPPP